MRFLAALLLVISFSAHAGIDQRESFPLPMCMAHMPYGQPEAKKIDTTLVCREGYLLEHDNKAKIPVWVSYSLTPKGAIGCSSREPGFEPEMSVRSDARAYTRDYAKSGYDMGHMANSADMRLTPQLSLESNILSNVAPQLPGLNRVAWKSLETRTRSWALGRNHTLLIYVGPIYDNKSSKRIGRGQVVVPDAFFKVIIDQQTNELMAFIYPQKASKKSPQSFLTSLAEVQKQSGLILPFPDKVVLSKATWPVTASSISKKNVACSAK